jgi:hypothetical protein
VHLRCLIAMIVGSLLPWLGAHAAEPAKAPGNKVVDLVQAYQSGYLEVVAISCFQLYSATGIVAVDFIGGKIDGQTAIGALEQSRLLHSACTSTLDEIIALTPEGDKVITNELGLLQRMLAAEGTLFNVLSDYYSQPTDANFDLVQKALADVEQLLEAYTSGSSN